MKISIIGAGAMGSLYGGKLSAAGADVVLYDINKEHVEAVNSGGLHIEDLATGEVETVHPRASADPNAVEGSDYIVVFVKSTATDAVGRQFAGLTGQDSIVITLQNGVGNDKVLERHFGPERTAAGVTSQGATFLGPGKIRHAGKGPTHLCMLNKQNHTLGPLVDAMNLAEFETHIEENIENLIWSKLVINIGINALTALTGLKNGGLLEHDETKRLVKSLVEEAVEVVEAKGLELTYPSPLEMVYTVCEKTGGNRSSMLQDFDRNSRTEIDFINYALVQEGEALGIPLPVNETVSLLVKTLDKIHAETKRS